MRLSADGEFVTLVTIYQPGSALVTSAFYELSTALESLGLQSGPVIVGGDVNIHVEDAADADAACLAAVFDAFDLQQHVVGGTLDIVATFSGCRVGLALDASGVISDHSLITCGQHITVPVRC